MNMYVYLIHVFSFFHFFLRLAQRYSAENGERGRLSFPRDKRPLLTLLKHCLHWRVIEMQMIDGGIVQIITLAVSFNNRIRSPGVVIEDMNGIISISFRLHTLLEKLSNISINVESLRDR